MPVSVTSGATCTSLTIEIEASANNFVVNVTGDLQDNTYLWNLLWGAEGAAVTRSPAYTQVSGTFNISGRYCEPKTWTPKRARSIQLLVHGITYTKEYWSALGFPGFEADTYSWIEFASKQGWPTLSIDRLGDGLSSQPDPINVVQAPLEVEILNNIVLALKSGVIAGRKFEKVVYVGHSYGSELGTELAYAHPEPLDALILTGFSSIRGNASVPLSEANTNLEIFRDLPSGYVVVPTAEQRSLLYGKPGSYDPHILELDTITQHTCTVGEIVSLVEPPRVASGLTAPVFFLIGDSDVQYCPGAHCVSDANASVALNTELFPNSRSFSFYVLPNTGHDLNLHYSAPLAFAHAHAWMEEQGF